MIYKANNKIKEIYLGNSKIKECYLGNACVFKNNKVKQFRLQIPEFTIYDNMKKSPCTLLAVDVILNEENNYSASYQIRYYNYTSRIQAPTTLTTATRTLVFDPETKIFVDSQASSSIKDGSYGSAINMAGLNYATTTKKYNTLIMDYCAIGGFVNGSKYNNITDTTGFKYILTEI